MPITPDDKDWTWVLQRPCPQCGFEPGVVDFADIPEVVRVMSGVWPAVLGRADAHIRPAPEVWSALEYAAHVRDALGVFADRLDLMLTQDDPEFANWDQDAAAEAGNYGALDPAAVAEEVRMASERMAAAFAAVPAHATGRTGRRSNGSAFTVLTLAQYLLHDLVHHAWDVTDGRPGLQGAAEAARAENECSESSAVEDPSSPDEGADVDADTAASTPPPPPIQAWANRHRRPLGTVLGVLSTALAVLFVLFPAEADTSGAIGVVLRWAGPVCWLLISATAFLWAWSTNTKLTNRFAYAALGCWVAFLLARAL